MSDVDRVTLLSRVRGSTTAQRDVFRAKIILLCAEGYSRVEVAEKLQAAVRTVNKWVLRFREEGLAGLVDAQRRGRPRHTSASQRMQIVSVACEIPENDGPKSHPRIEDIRDEVLRRGIVDKISWTNIQKILAEAPLKPHKVQGWLHSPDPNFKDKVNEVVGLYLSAPEGSIVLSIDEKSGMQATERKYPDRPPAVGRLRRREFEYKRHGTQTLFAALNVHSGHVLGRCKDHRSAKDLLSFMEEVAVTYPEKTIHVIWDNLNTHYDGRCERWRKFNARHGHRFVFHFTPKHASWVNQVELFFSILERQCLRLGSFTSVQAQRDAIEAYLAEYNRKPKPFQWKFIGYPKKDQKPSEAAA